MGKKNIVLSLIETHNLGHILTPRVIQKSCAGSAHFYLKLRSGNVPSVHAMRGQTNNLTSADLRRVHERLTVEKDRLIAMLNDLEKKL